MLIFEEPIVPTIPGGSSQPDRAAANHAFVEALLQRRPVAGRAHRPFRPALSLSMKWVMRMLVAWASGGFAIAALAADNPCSQHVSAAYTTSLAAEMLGARPDAGLASMVDEISALSGCPVELLTLPTARVWASFEKGDLNLVIGATQTDERDQVAEFVPLVRFPLLLVTQHPAGSIPDHLEDLAARRLRVGLLRGMRLPADAQAIVDDLRRQGLIDEATDREEAYRKLEGGRDDVIVATAAPIDRPERNSLRVIPQTQLSRLVNGTYLRRAPFTDAERERLKNAIVKASLDHESSFHPQ